MFIINYYKYFYAFSVFLTLAAVFIFFRFPIKPSLEFIGGSLLEIQYEAHPPLVANIMDSLVSFSLQNLVIQPSAENRFILRFQEINEETHQALLTALTGAKEVRFETVGPIIGKELRQKSVLALIVSVIATFVYILLAFRKVGGKIPPWKMSLATIIALLHDVMITIAGFVFFAWWAGHEMGAAFVVAILTVWGYSIHDTVVVFDRFREKIRKNLKEPLKMLAGASIRETIGRSINTSLAVFLLLMFLEVLGPSVLRPFLVTLLIGVVVGTYSSICIAMPLLLGRLKSSK